MLTCVNAISATDISGSLSGIYGPGIYHVMDTVSVESGDSAQLMPATTFIFDGPYPFKIEGTLMAEGTATDSIIFATDPGANPLLWRGLRFHNSSSSGSRLFYCLVENSQATGTDYDRYGGCAFCFYSSPSFSHCTFKNGSAQWGGGIACQNASPTFSSCVFYSNTSSTYGGGMYSWYSSPAFTNCIFTTNSAQFGGGAYCSGMSPAFIHCTFYGNLASVTCGGVYCSNSSPSVISSIIANSTGTGFSFWNASSSQIRHCDLFNNSAGAIGFSSGNPSNGPAGIGQIATVNANGDSSDIYYNIFLNPYFLYSGPNNLQLADTSHCIGAAQIGGPDEDFEGNPRPNPADSRPDIGAFENANGTIPPSGLAGSLSGTLGPGTYTIIDTIYVDAEDSLRLLPGTFFYFYDPYPFIIYGTLIAEGTETDSIIFAPDPVANPFGWRGLRFLSLPSSGSRFAYCLIKDGRATGTTIESKRGGGVYCESSSPSFAHCVFEDNWAEYDGGGISRF
jgi:hypothetical protein